MPQKHGALQIRLSKYLGSGSMAIAALILAGNAAWADDFNQGRKGNEAGDDRATRLVKIIPVPASPGNNTAGGMYSYDISWVDQPTQKYYLADRSNKAIQVVDAKTGTLLAPLQATPAFAGVSASNNFATTTAGPNGVVTAEPPFPWLFVTDGGSRVVTINVNTGATVADVVTKSGDPTRADELAYDPRDGLLLVINNIQTATHNPFMTLIKVTKATGALSVIKNIDLVAAAGVTNGAEQPVWEPATGRFYLSLPSISGTVESPPGPGTLGAVARIVPTGPTAGKIEALFPIDFCGPAGLTVGPRQDLFVGCNTVYDTAGNVWDPNGALPAAPKGVIIDAKTGKKDPSVLDANVFGVGAGDEVWFNRGDGNYYATGSGSPFRPLPAATAKGATPLGVVDAKDQRILQQLTTYNVPAVLTGSPETLHPAGTAHSVAANAANNRIFVPLGPNNSFSSFATPPGEGTTAPNCLTGCIAVFAHTDED